MIDLKEILINSNYKKETEDLINIANLTYKHWETYWTGFNSTYVCEEILKDFENLNDFKFFIYGGFSSSQRSRIACFRGDNIPEEDELKSNFPAQGIKINGNFLFDNATQDDFRSLLIENGVNQIKVGDIWTIGDRGAQGIIDNSNICSIEGTNVIRVPFGKKFSKKKRPEKNQNIATLILPLSSYSNPTPPHVA